ncbi:MAG: ubiquinol-cytochrome C chaperone family protein [Sphingosinicella sp.]
MTLLRRLFARDAAAIDPLYRAIVARARDSAWYVEGAVPDTPTGRFDLVAALTALVLLRLEPEGEAGRSWSVALTEAFVDDMRANLREMGTSEPGLGKAVGRLVRALGGRIKAFRRALDEEDFEPAVRRNIFHDSEPASAALAEVSKRLSSFAKALDERPLAGIVAGELS